MATQQGYAPVDPGVAGLDGGRVRLTSAQLDDLDSRIDPGDRDVKRRR